MMADLSNFTPEEYERGESNCRFSNGLSVSQYFLFINTVAQKKPLSKGNNPMEQPCCPKVVKD